jgi:hypothetical protein
MGIALPDDDVVAVFILFPAVKAVHDPCRNVESPEHDDHGSGKVFAISPLCPEKKVLKRLTPVGGGDVTSSIRRFPLPRSVTTAIYTASDLPPITESMVF